MNSFANGKTIDTPMNFHPAYAAEVVSIDGATLVVRRDGDWSCAPSPARRALPPAVTVEPGDEVLVLGLGTREAFVIARLAADDAEALRLTDGTCVEKSAAGSCLTVRDATGRTLFQYDVDDGGVVTLRGETIRLQSQSGGIELDSAKDVRIRGRAISLEGRELQFSADRFGVRGRELEAQLHRARVRLRRLEIIADVIVETARDVYRKVRGLAQLRAGRVKTICDGTVWLKAKQVIHRSTGAYKVKSDDIQLG